MSIAPFSLPQQKPPGRDAFDTRATAVKQWIAELPVGHTGETARRLFEMLQEVNQLAIPARTRVELMTLIEPRILQILEAMQRHYIGATLPLPKKSVRVALLSNTLLSEVVNGWQAALEDGREGIGLFHFGQRRRHLVALQRVMFYIGRVIDNFCYLYRPVPAGLWRGVHHTYLLARSQKLHKSYLNTPDNRETTIEEEYKRLLLCSMLNSQLLRDSQLEELRQSLPAWTRHALLLDPEHRPEGLFGYCIRTDSDAPESGLTQRCCGDCEVDGAGFVLDTSRIVELLEKLHHSLGTRDSVFMEQSGSRLSRETIELLQHSWHPPGEVREARTPCEAEVSLAIGMSVVHALLSLDAQSDSNDNSFWQGINLDHLALEVDDEELESEASRAWREARQHGGWNVVFGNMEVEPKSWVKAVDERSLEYTPAKQLDYNENGYRVTFDETATTARLKVGELVGLRSSQQGELELCVVRWLSCEEQKVTLGMKRLATEVVAHSVALNLEGRNATLYCLLGVGHDREPLLFMPTLPGLRKKGKSMTLGGSGLTLRLLDKVSDSPVFEAFHYDVAKEEGGAREMEGKDMASSRASERQYDSFDDQWDAI